MAVQFEAISGPKFMLYQDDTGNPFQMPMHMSDGLYHIPRQRYWASKSSVSCEVVKNRSAVLCPRVFGGGGPKNFFSSLLP